ncbi:hypothetical protein GQ53DRAFT_132031 [Thozetella sp. PMI_491]|nr:hypothetical protein GQ53DRAFT_132031 [Thozetella sp. PMI_491]
MFPTLLRRAADTSRSQLARGAGPYKLKKVWPPDFSQLSAAEQLKFEKRYKRRLRLMGARPRWNRMLKLVQLFGVTSVVVYGLLFMQDKQAEEEPFHQFRQSFWSFFGSFSESSRFENSARTVEADREQRK